METTSRADAGSEWDNVQERPLDAEELARLRKISRRYRRRAILLAVWCPAAFLLFVMGIAESSSYIGRSSGAHAVYGYAVLIGPALLFVLSFAALSTASTRDSGLRAGIAGGVAACMQGHLQWARVQPPLTRRLIRAGLFQPDAALRQSVEAIPGAGLIWRVNGVSPGRLWFEGALTNPGAVDEDEDDDPEKEPEGDEGSSAGVRRWLWGIAAAAIAFGALYLVNLAAASLWFGRWHVLAAGTVLAGYLALIAAHEGGHLLLGRLMRMRFVAVQVGPVLAAQTAGGRSVTWQGLEHIVAGHALMAPEDESRFRRRDGWATAGGPLGSLIMAAVFALVGWGLWPDGVAPLFRDAMRLLALIAGAHAIFSGVPGFYAESDGSALWALWTDPEGTRFSAAQATLLGRVAAGQRPRDWDEGLLSRALRDPWGGYDSWAHTMLSLHYLDAGRPERARIVLEAALAVGDHPALRYEAAFLEGLYAHDAAAARMHWEAAGPKEDDADARRAEAAVLLAEGDLSAARAAAGAAIALLNTEIGAGLAAAKEERLRDLLAECDATGAQ
ncbi:MAG TPA: hypothetical protein VGM37_03085 [Armatimonadota bacterium]|jgi:hypothetical protein